MIYQWLLELQIGLISSKLAFDWLIQIMDVIIQFSSIDFTISISQQSILTLCVIHTSIFLGWKIMTFHAPPSNFHGKGCGPFVPNWRPSPLVTVDRAIIWIISFTKFVTKIPPCLYFGTNWLEFLLQNLWSYYLIE